MPGAIESVPSMFKIKEFLCRTGLLAMEAPSPNSSNCTICFDMANDKDELTLVQRLPCGHLFHKACIMRWLSCKSVCPNCRREVEDVPSRERSQLIGERALDSSVLLWPRSRPPVSTYVQRLDAARNSLDIASVGHEQQF